MPWFRNSYSCSLCSDSWTHVSLSIREDICMKCGGTIPPCSSDRIDNRSVDFKRRRAAEDLLRNGTTAGQG